MSERGDWSVGELDLGAYLERVGYAGPPPGSGPSGALLAALYRAHLSAIRFENLDVFLKGRVDVGLGQVQEKIVARGRGGYCYEQAQLLGAALERLGFGVERLLARVGPDGGPARPRTHLTLRVRAGQEAWLADAGFGSAPPAPLSLRRYRSGGPQETDGWVYEIAPEDDGATWKLREYQAGSWVTLHRWDDFPVEPVDVVLSNHYTSTHPDSWFTWQPVVVRRDPDAIRSLLGRTRTVTRAGHVKDRGELTDREFAAALTGEFGLRLTPDEVDAVVSAPAGRDRSPAPGVAPGT